MDTTTNPAPKKKHHATIAREKAQAMDLLLKQYGSIEAIHTAMDAPTPVPTASDVTVSVSPPETAVPVALDTTDPLAWITKETTYVALVSGTAVFTLYPGQIDKKGQGNIQLTNTGNGPWLYMPFDLSNPADRTDENNQKVMKARWWNHTFPKPTAERIYQENIRPVPTTAVLTATDFEKWDPIGRQAVGVHTPLEEFVPLREEVRRLLQRHANTFMDWQHHRSLFDPEFPNPYRNRIGRAGKIMPEVRQWRDRSGLRA